MINKYCTDPDELSILKILSEELGIPQCHECEAPHPSEVTCDEYWEAVEVVKSYFNDGAQWDA